MLNIAARRRWAASALVCASMLSAGCQRQQKTDAGKTYSPDNKNSAQGAGAAGGSQSDAKPLDAPADTTNGKVSRASDAGSSDAVRGQAVAEPGAPVAHTSEKKPRQDTQKPSGHQ